MTPAVVPATWADAAALSQVIADAFHDLAPSRWLIPDEAARRRIFPGYFRIFVEHSLATGTVYTTPGRTAVALWLPVGQDGPQPPASYDARLAEETGRWVDRFLIFDAELDRHHPAGTAHHHLALMAVHPDHQRQGVGTALLHAHHTTLDETGIPAYLEASGTRSRAWYLRHGYTDYGPGPIELPEETRMYPMMRPARHLPVPPPRM
jgi:GNAT superfamily N-acetyltransferase